MANSVSLTKSSGVAKILATPLLFLSCFLLDGIVVVGIRDVWSCIAIMLFTITFLYIFLTRCYYCR